jgi:uncharacterized membrane protein YqiK
MNTSDPMLWFTAAVVVSLIVMLILLFVGRNN